MWSWVGSLSTKMSLEVGGGWRGLFCQQIFPAILYVEILDFHFRKSWLLFGAGSFIFEFTSWPEPKPKCVDNLKGVYKIKTWPRRSPKMPLNKKEMSGSKVYKNNKRWLCVVIETATIGMVLGLSLKLPHFLSCIWLLIHIPCTLRKETDFRRLQQVESLISNFKLFWNGLFTRRKPS